MAFSAAQLTPFLTELQAARRVWVGFSGGLDSTVLLHATTGLLSPAKISAIHVNHQLSPRADDWARHCRAYCAALGVALFEETVHLKNRESGLENAARELRYGVFEALLEHGDVLLLAHHADDQVETVLYRLLRGAGPRGLAGIPESRVLGSGRLLRPLLNVTRPQLADYGKRHGLPWIEDESNRQTDVDRNYLRHRVIPALAQRWPDYRTRIAASATLCGSADRLNTELARTDLALLQERNERLGWSVDAARLLQLDRERRANVLRCWAANHTLPSPGRRALTALTRDLLAARSDAAPVVSWRGGQWRRFRERLYLLPPDGPVIPRVPGVPGVSGAGLPMEWALHQPCKLPDGSVLSAAKVAGRGLKISAGARVTVQLRAGGERCKPTGRNGSQTLKILFQEYALEPWLRDRIPLLYIDTALAAVGDLWLNEGFAAGPDETGFLLTWRYGAESVAPQ